jgi:hypothetical protein
MKTIDRGGEQYKVIGQDNEHGLLAAVRLMHRGSEKRKMESVVLFLFRVERQEGKNKYKSMKELCLGAYPHAKWNDGSEEYGAVHTEIRLGVHYIDLEDLRKSTKALGIADLIWTDIKKQFPTMVFDLDGQDFPTFFANEMVNPPGLNYDHGKVPYHIRRGFGPIASEEERIACANAIEANVGILSGSSMEKALPKPTETTVGASVDPATGCVVANISAAGLETIKKNIVEVIPVPKKTKGKKALKVPKESSAESL